MSVSWPRILTVARREYLTTVRRKAFLLTLIATPAYFAFVMMFTMRAGEGERAQVMRDLKAIGMIDSSGLFANASHEITTEMRAIRRSFPVSGPGLRRGRAARGGSSAPAAAGAPRRARPGGR